MNVTSPREGILCKFRATFTQTLFRDGRAETNMIEPQETNSRFTGALTVMEDATTHLPALSIRIASDEDDFLSLREEWERLEETAFTTVFQTFEWQFLWWKHFAASHTNRLQIIAFESDEGLVGIAPLFIQTYSFLGFKVLRKLKFLGSGLGFSGSSVLSLDSNGPSDYLDIIIKPGYQAKVAEALATYLTDYSRPWDEIELQNIPGDGNSAKYLLPLLQASDNSILTDISDPCPRIVLPNSLDEFLSSLKHSGRRMLMSSQKHILDQPGCIVDEVKAGTDTDEAMNMLAILHQHRWNKVGYPGLFSDKRFKAFQFDLAKTMNEKGRLWLKLLRQNGKAISARLAFKYKSRVYDYLSGFEPAHDGSAKNSPGVALLLRMISESISEGFNVFDMLRGGEDYKYKLTPVAEYNRTIQVRGMHRVGLLRRSIFSAYELYSLLMSRATCEISIMALIYKESGPLQSIPSYLRHVLRRVSRSFKSSTDRVGNAATAGRQTLRTIESND